MTNEPTTENETLENEVVETTEEQSTDSAEETTENQEEVKRELTPAQKLGAMERSRKKLLRDNPELLQDKDPEVKPVSQDSLSREEGYLVAKGVELDGLDKLNRIAELDGITIMEAYESEDYAIWTEKREREVKRKASQLESTRGGTRAKQEKTLDTPGLSRDEHKKMWEKQNKK